MPKGTRVCKVCGIEYEYCHTQRPSETFRWQDVACCPEHAEEYLKRIRESRKQKESVVEVNNVEEIKPSKKKKKSNNVIDINALKL